MDVDRHHSPHHFEVEEQTCHDDGTGAFRCDRDALLALADSLDASARLETYPLDRGGGVPILSRELAEMALSVARRIREACGEG